MKTAYIILGIGIILAIAGVGISGYFNSNDVVSMDTNFKLSSSAFENGGMIPEKYTCDGERLLNPPLQISGVPEGAKSLVLLVNDPDIPQVFKDERGIDAFDHWVVYAIPPETTEIPEGASLGASGLNGAGNSGYTGPCPPTEYEPTTHRYIFKLYALDGTLNFIKEPTLAEVKTAIESMVVAETELVGTYDRSR